MKGITDMTCHNSLCLLSHYIIWERTRNFKDSVTKVTCDESPGLLSAQTNREMKLLHPPEISLKTEHGSCCGVHYSGVSTCWHVWTDLTGDLGHPAEMKSVNATFLPVRELVQGCRTQLRDPNPNPRPGASLKGYSVVSLIHGLTHRETVLDSLSRD